MSKRLATWSAALTALLTTVTFALAITTLPRTGPFVAPGEAIPYPYDGAAAFVPRDFLWLYPALLWLVAFLALAVVLRERAAQERKAIGTIGLSLATTSVAVLGANYFIQLSTVQPALLKGEGADIVAISQYNPHGVFIALETFGFLTMALSFGFFALCLGATRSERVVHWLFLAAPTLAVVAWVGMSLYFGFELEYLFEIAIISIDWVTLIVAGTLLAFAFQQSSDTAASSGIPRL